MWLALLLGATLIWPMYDGYDEPEHFDMAYVYSAHPLTFYGPGELGRTKGSLGSERQVPGTPPTQPLAGVPIADRPSRPSLDDLGGGEIIQVSQPNQMVQHPPLYYWAAAVVLRLPGVSNLAWDIQVWLVRLLSVLFLLPVPTLCWASARRLLGDRSSATMNAAVLAALVPLSIPNLVRDGAAVSNDSLLILSVSVLVYFLCRVMTGDLRKRVAAGVAVSLCAALWTKGFALVLPPIVLVAYLGAGWRAARRDRGAVGRSVVGTPLAISLIGAVVGGLWWLRNVVEFGTVQINGYGTTFTDTAYGPRANIGTLREFVRPFTTSFIRRIWGGIGVGDDPSLPQVVVVGWALLVGIGLGVSLLRRRGPDDRLRAATLLLIPLLSFGIVAVGSFGHFRAYSQVTSAQGRYIYHSVVVLAVLGAIGWACFMAQRVLTWVIRAVAVAAVLTNALAWRAILDAWYAPPQSESDRILAGFKSLLRWSPVPVGVTVTVSILLPLAAAAWLLFILLRSGAGTPTPSPDRLERIAVGEQAG